LVWKKLCFLKLKNTQKNCINKKKELKKRKNKLRAPIHKLGAPWLISYLAYLREKKFKKKIKENHPKFFLSKKKFKINK
jgi:hypothetical protein